jgi:hypothetical protein
MERVSHHAPSSAAGLTPALFAKTVRLHVEMTAVIERSRDLCWWAHQLRARPVSAGPRPIRGGASADDAATIVTMISGVSLCADCISRKSGIPLSQVDAILTTVAGTVALAVGTRSCDACLETKRTYGFDAGNGSHPGTPRPRGTQYAILNFLGQHRGATFCADCIAARLFPGKNIDVAMRHLEGNGMNRHHGRCSACGKSRLVASLPSPS